MNRLFTHASVVLATTGLVVASAGVALAAQDGPVIQTPDAAGFTTPGTVSFGEICTGATATAPIAIKLERGTNGNGGGSWANGATVTLARTVSPSSPFSADAISPSTIGLPSNWLSRPIGTDSATAANTSVSFQPTTPATSSSSLTYRGTGPSANDKTLASDVDVSLTGKGRVCDSTAPIITHTVAGTVGNNGWFTSNVTVSFNVSDGESAVTSTSADCAGVTRGTDTSSVTYTCTATSSGGTTSDSVTIKRDATKPTGLTVSPDRAAVNGWYNAPITATWTGNDTTSGIASCASTTYSGPDTSAGSVNGSCTDMAGNTEAGPAFSFTYDATGPGVTGSLDRSPDHNGWYNHAVTATWSADGDALSAVTCDAPTSYSGPDAAAVNLQGHCTDAAGNVGTGSLSFDYDATAPSAAIAANRGPDHDGWYNAPFTAETTGTDAGGSGVDSCTAEQVFGDEEPDTASGQLSGTCTDVAGNTSAEAQLSFKYDDTAPAANVTLDTDNLHNGWYNGPVTGTTTGSDNLSDVTCTDEQTYSGPDGADKAMSGTCTDEAGNVSLPDTQVFNYDETAPTITLESRTAANANGWNNAAVTVTWSCTDETSLPVSDTVSDSTSAEGENQTAHGTCQDNAGNSASDSLDEIDIDLSKPAAAISADRDPDSNGWYNHAVTAKTTGADELSGIDFCSLDETYGDTPGEPDTAGGTLTGSCTDKAGNVSDDATLEFEYDASAPQTPTPHMAPASNAAGWNNSKPVTVSFSDNADVGPSGVASCTSDQLVDAETTGQAVSGTCTDEAGNESDPSSVSVRIDVTKPNAPILTADRAPEFADWYRDTVTVTSTDNGDPGEVQSGVDTATVDSARTFTTSGQHTVIDSVEDIADNESATANLSVKVDAANPVVTLTCPSQVELGSTASAIWTATDQHSGISGVAHGSITLNTASIGSRAASLAAGAAKDNVGHGSDAATCSYAVVYGWDGFLQPINDTAHTGQFESKFKLGSTVPVKFMITNAAGTSVPSSTTPQFQVSANRGACDTEGTSESAPDLAASAGTAFKWTDGQYHYNFSTKGKAAGEYRVWVTGVDDGANHYVDLCLTK